MQLAKKTKIHLMALQRRLEPLKSKGKCHTAIAFRRQIEAIHQQVTQLTSHHPQAILCTPQNSALNIIKHSIRRTYLEIRRKLGHCK